MNDVRRQRLVVTVDTRPQLARFVKLRHDPGRERWTLLAPERVMTPDDIAIDVLKLCDGERTLSDIAAILSKDYDAPAEAIADDLIELLQGLADDGYLKG